MLTDVTFDPPLLTDNERENLRAAVDEFAAPLRPSRGLRFYIADALLLIGDMLVVAGHALGTTAEKIDPHP